MKKTICALAAAITLTTGVWLRAQESDQASTAPADVSEKTKSAPCEDMCGIKDNSQKPGNLLGWEQELNLSEEQRARLRAIEDKATNEAKAMLTTEQQDKLNEHSKSQSMMKCMRLMKHAKQTDGDIEHALSVGCSQMQGNAEEAHSSH